MEPGWCFSVSLFLKSLFRPAKRHPFDQFTYPCKKFLLSINYVPSTGSVLGPFVMLTWRKTSRIFTSLADYKCAHISLFPLTTTFNVIKSAHLLSITQSISQNAQRETCWIKAPPPAGLTSLPDKMRGTQHVPISSKEVNGNSLSLFHTPNPAQTPSQELRKREVLGLLSRKFRAVLLTAREESGQGKVPEFQLHPHLTGNSWTHSTSDSSACKSICTAADRRF